MSLITSCPACGTMFRVVPDQLKISEGWVRCGHCSEVFDATAHLSNETVAAPPPPPPAETAPATAPDALLSAWQSTSAAPLSIPGVLGPPPPAAPADTYADGPADSRPDSQGYWPPGRPEPEDRRGADSQSLDPSPLDTPFVFRRSEFNQGDNHSSVLPPEPEPEMPHSRGYDDEPELGDMSFVRQARRKALWRRPSMRLALALVSLLLAAVLVLQAAYQDRDRLALAEPALRPALQRMCELLQCTLGAPRQIDAIAIENSGFNRLRNDTYRLAFTLRNGASVAVAAPAMELTLTDAQDQTIARRVLTAAELDGGEAIPASGEWSHTVGLVLDTGGPSRVAGYRLLAFYP